jgi:hypothetical protein
MTTERTDASFLNVKELENFKENNQSKNILLNQPQKPENNLLKNMACH